MATLMMILLVVGYGASVWSLSRQTHFNPQSRAGRTKHRPYDHGWRSVAGEAR
jgi:hypothetical protein